MSQFRCHKCDYTSDKTGSCPDCKLALVKVCPFCGEEIDACTCQASREQTKGGTKP